jgi:hypothetical protein
MKKLIYLLTIVALVAFITESCNDGHVKKPEAQTQESTKQNASIMDPNQPKPMALMMRLMANNADSMKKLILNNEKLDSLVFPFLRFYLVQPTDPDVLEPQFYENAKQFQAAYKSLFTYPTEQKKYYNLMIGQCISCHQSYCSGPLKRINKMPIK